MKDANKTKEQLLRELHKTRKKVAKLEKLESEIQKTNIRAANLTLLKELLIGKRALTEKLKSITDSVVYIFEADFARIWMTKDGDLCNKGCIHASVTEGPHICRDRSHCLHLMASSGRYTHIDGYHRRVPLGSYKIGRVASGDDPKFITNDVTHDPQVHDHEWAKNLRLVSFAGYRLLSPDKKPIGVLALFSKDKIHREQEALLEDLASTTSQIILVGNMEWELNVADAKLQTLFEKSKTPMMFIDEDTKIIQINNECEKFTGYLKEEVEGKKSWKEFVSKKDDLERMTEYHRLRRIDAESAPQSYEFQFMDKKGQLKDINVTVEMVDGTKLSLAALQTIHKKNNMKN